MGHTDTSLLNKKLTEWARIDTARVENPDTGERWYYEESIPDFTNSLDACLKWLVPRLTFWEVIQYNDLWTKAYVWAGEESTQFGKHESPEPIHPALALCLAISKLIDGEK